MKIPEIPGAKDYNNIPQDMPTLILQFRGLMHNAGLDCWISEEFEYYVISPHADIAPIKTPKLRKAGALFSYVKNFRPEWFL